MPEFNNNAQMSLLHRILEAVAKYCADQQRYNARQDNLEEQNDLANSWKSLSDFEEYQRSNEEDIIKYVSKFDKKYQQVVMRGITLSPEVLALKILSRARLSKQERRLIIRCVDFTRKDRLYEETKRALEMLGNHTLWKTNARYMVIENI